MITTKKVVVFLIALCLIALGGWYIYLRNSSKLVSSPVSVEGELSSIKKEGLVFGSSPSITRSEVYKISGTTSPSTLNAISYSTKTPFLDMVIRYRSFLKINHYVVKVDGSENNKQVFMATKNGEALTVYVTPQGPALTLVDLIKKK